LFPPVEPGDACLHLGPISHGSGYLFTPVWLGGGRNVMIDKFDPARVLELMEQEKIAYMFMVPTMLNALVREPSIATRDFSALKCICIAAAPIADDTALRGHAAFGNALYQLYGQTEVLPVAAMTGAQWFRTDLPGSNPLRACGMPLPFAELEIWDENNKPVAPGEAGQIVAKSDGQMSGFWNDEQGTRERMVDGWVLTGDVGMLDANGYLYMLDRANDMIVSGGFNIYPAELENAIADHPAVIEVAVFGVPHEKWGEAPMAVCTIDGKLSVSEQELIALCADKLGSYKKPHRVEFRREPLPKTPVGKVKRRELREPFWKGQARRIAGS
jgi:acyl-CoA synthetase (AMP-forming)/AMP-acid ligase II